MTCFRATEPYTLQSPRRTASTEGFTRITPRKSVTTQDIREGDLVESTTWTAFAGAIGVRLRRKSRHTSLPRPVCTMTPDANAHYYAATIRPLVPNGTAVSNWDQGKVLDRLQSPKMSLESPRTSHNKSYHGSHSTNDEQATIVRYLDHADELINRYISAKERLIALLEEQRQAVIHQAVTRGFESNVPLKPSHVANVPLMPTHWEIKRLKSMSRIRYGLGQTPRESPNGLPLIRATNVNQGHITEKGMMFVDPSSIPTTRDAVLQENDIIVVRSGAYTADSAIIPKRYEGAISGYDMVVTATRAHPEFLALALLSAYVRDDQLIVESNRAAQPHLNAEELGNAKILTPPRPEQDTIVRRLRQSLTDIEGVKQRTIRQIGLIKEYRTRLIADVVTGQIDVHSIVVELHD